MKFKIQAALLIALSLCLTSSSIYSQKVFVDPGHGGPGAGMDNGENGGGSNQHRGAVGPYYQLTEQWCNYEVATSLYSYLVSANYEVQLSRWSWTEDVSVEERVNQANTWGANVYLSVHHNGLPLNDQGTETFYCDENLYWYESQNSCILCPK